MQLAVPHLFLVNIGQIYCVLRSIKTDKSPGLDLIPNKIVKMFAFDTSRFYIERLEKDFPDVTNFKDYGSFCNPLDNSSRNRPT